MAKIVGVYSIQSISKPERIYIGSAGEKTGIYERWNTHILRLKQGNHHSKTLQRHYNKYGADDLVFEIIEDGVYISPQQLLAREQHWMYWFRYSKTWKPYFNALPIAGSGYGGKHSAKSRKRMSQQRKGKKKPPQHGINVSKALKGKPKNITPEQIKVNIDRMAEINRGKKHSEETCKKKSESLLKFYATHPSRKIPEEEKKSHGRPQSEKRRQEIREWWAKLKAEGKTPWGDLKKQ